MTAWGLAKICQPMYGVQQSLLRHDARSVQRGGLALGSVGDSARAGSGVARNLASMSAISRGKWRDPASRTIPAIRRAGTTTSMAAVRFWGSRPGWATGRAPSAASARPNPVAIESF